MRPRSGQGYLVGRTPGLETRAAVHGTILGRPEGDGRRRRALRANDVAPGSTVVQTWASGRGIRRHAEADSLGPRGEIGIQSGDNDERWEGRRTAAADTARTQFGRALATLTENRVADLQLAPWPAAGSGRRSNCDTGRSRQRMRQAPPMTLDRPGPTPGTAGHRERTSEAGCRCPLPSTSRAATSPRQ